MSEIMKSIGANIKEIRQLRNYTRNQLADYLCDHGVQTTASLVGAWERGERRIHAEALLHICHALSCSAMLLYGLPQEIQINFSILSEHERQIIEYMFNAWDGDAHALLEYCGMYMAADNHTRAEMTGTAMTIFREARNSGRTLPVPYDVRTHDIIRKLQELE